MVAGTGLEPVRIAPFDFKSNAYTNSAIRPPYIYYIIDAAIAPSAAAVTNWFTFLVLQSPAT